MEIDPRRILEKYYEPYPKALEILMVHSRAVADKALSLISGCSDLDKQFVEEAAMLHDIGVFRCNAPDIGCTGMLPYICHGAEGGKILRSEGLEKHALVCERHTGAGLTAREIVDRHLPLPAVDMLPVTPEERLICYADKFFSKSKDLRREKTLQEIRRSLEKFGSATMSRFEALHKEFGD